MMSSAFSGSATDTSMSKVQSSTRSRPSDHSVLTRMQMSTSSASNAVSNSMPDWSLKSGSASSTTYYPTPQSIAQTRKTSTSIQDHITSWSEQAGSSSSTWNSDELTTSSRTEWDYDDIMATSTSPSLWQSTSTFSPALSTSVPPLTSARAAQRSMASQSSSSSSLSMVSLVNQMRPSVGLSPSATTFKAASTDSTNFDRDTVSGDISLSPWSIFVITIATLFLLACLLSPLWIRYRAQIRSWAEKVLPPPTDADDLSRLPSASEKSRRTSVYDGIVEARSSITHNMSPRSMNSLDSNRNVMRDDSDIYGISPAHSQSRLLSHRGTPNGTPESTTSQDKIDAKYAESATADSEGEFPWPDWVRQLHILFPENNSPSCSPSHSIKRSVESGEYFGQNCGPSPLASPVQLKREYSRPRKFFTSGFQQGSASGRLPSSSRREESPLSTSHRSIQQSSTRGEDYSRASILPYQYV